MTARSTENLDRVLSEDELQIATGGAAFRFAAFRGGLVSLNPQPIPPGFLRTPGCPGPIQR
jgi:hypothetical protein